MALRACRVLSCAAAAAETSAPKVAPLSNKAKAAVLGVVNMPTRAIAAVLLKEGAPVRNVDLYERASEYGFFNSHRHFKHVLRMMKKMDRVQVIAGPPETPGGDKRSFRTKLTRRGENVYRYYLGDAYKLPPEQAKPVGLAEAISQ